MKVSLSRITPDAQHVIADAYGVCTDKQILITSIPKWIKRGHLSPVEHASATFRIEGI